jgi:hypothetical protein
MTRKETTIKVIAATTVEERTTPIKQPERALRTVKRATVRPPSSSLLPSCCALLRLESGQAAFSSGLRPTLDVPSPTTSPGWVERTTARR